MVSFNEIAVFVLATSQGKQVGKPFSQWERRLEPLAQTWGAYFPHFYGVMGRNQYDIGFLANNCEIESKWSTLGRDWKEDTGNVSASRLAGRHQAYDESHEAHRMLIAREKQGKYRDVVSVWNCSLPYARPASHPRLWLHVLMAHACTGEYFGAGPTCRAEEAMLAYLQLPTLQHTSWFIFIDDDVYMRPQVLVSFLTWATTTTKVPAETVFLFTEIKRGFGYAARKLGHNCSDPDVHGFYFAQPAILSRPAMEKMRLALTRRAMRQLQSYWGGSHDAVLGMFVYLHSLPVWSLAHNYIGHALYDAPPEDIRHAIDTAKDFIIHKVRNQKLGLESDESKKKMVGHTAIFHALHDGDAKHREHQEAVGKAAAAATLPLPIADPTRMSRFDPSRPESMTKEMCK